MRDIQVRLEDTYGKAVEGEIDPIKAYIDLYEVAKMADEFRKELLDIVIEKREQYPDKDFTQSGYKVSVASSTRFDYYGDFELDRLKALTMARQEMMKRAYQFQEKGGTFFDENGEAVLPATPKTTTTIKLERIK